MGGSPRNTGGYHYFKLALPKDLTSAKPIKEEKQHQLWEQAR